MWERLFLEELSGSKRGAGVHVWEVEIRGEQGYVPECFASSEEGGGLAFPPLARNLSPNA